MSDDLDALDRQRKRWRSARQILRLIDPDGDDFASCGLVRRVGSPSVRLLVLPEDPESWSIDFDDIFTMNGARDHGGGTKLQNGRPVRDSNVGA